MTAQQPTEKRLLPENDGFHAQRAFSDRSCGLPRELSSCRESSTIIRDARPVWSSLLLFFVPYGCADFVVL
jgi:hypothetical protein